MDGSDTRRIVILGKTQAGKSSLANTLFGEKLFRISSTLNSETGQCEAKTKSVNGQILTLIDTHGFFGINTSEKHLKSEILKCSSRPHVFLIVLKVEKFTKQEQDTISKIEKFSKDVLKFGAVVFTHGDQLDEGQTIEDFVHQNKSLSVLVQKCGGRCHVIDNKYWNREHEYRSNKVQVKKLLKTIDKMVSNRRKQARDRVLKKCMLAHITTGALLGLLLGGALRGGVAVVSLTTLAGAFAAIVIGRITGYFKAEEAEKPQQGTMRTGEGSRGHQE